MRKLLLYNVTTIIVLLICYISLFGWKSLEKYLKKDVFIITEEESLPSISPPGLYYTKLALKIYIVFLVSVIYIMSANPSTGSGWKDNHWLNRTDDQMFDWTEIEKNGYYVQDILILKENSTLNPTSRQGNIIELFEASSNRSIEIQSY